MKPSGIGGQAVLEGVMMKNKSRYAVAVRKPDNNIIVDIREYHGIGEKYSFFKLPFIRGIAVFVESMIIGMRTLNFSADILEEEEQNDKSDKDKDNKNGVGNIMAVIAAVLLAVGIFMILPYILSQLFKGMIKSRTLLILVEGIIRIILFIGYVLAISAMSDIKRVFMYHGAEHKAINCIENGYELNIDNVKIQSRHHKRCGTSFMFIVMFISVVAFMFIRTSSPILRIIVRLLLIPVIAGISYEFIKLAGRSSNKFIEILSKPGMWLQALTTREPEDSMIEVAIASIEAVFDWKKFISVSASENKKKKNQKSDNKNSELLNSLEEEDETSLTEQDKVKERATVKENLSTSLLEKEEEDDEVLKALDRFFVYEGKKTIIETSEGLKKKTKKDSEK